MVEDKRLHQAIENLKSKNVTVLRQALWELSSLKDVRAIEPLIDLWCDEVRWKLLANEPEDWDALHIIQHTMIDIGSPAVPTLLGNLKRDNRLIYVLSEIADDTAADGLLALAHEFRV